MTALTRIPYARMDGSTATLEDYSGAVVLIVNVASACGLTPQYEGLETLYENYRDKGLVVIGFPANDFAGQEPGSNEEIAEFCRGTYGVEFPVAQKISVAGEGRHPLYAALIDAWPHATLNPDGALRQRLESHSLGPENDTDVLWNFEKFLVGRDGQVVGRFAPDIAPLDDRIVAAIETALAQ
ncbi:MAG: glutathione peroxidase [Porticoccaceae bacterium]